MDKSLSQAVQLIHRSPTRIVLYVTGGASHVSSWLLSVPGASKTVLEARIPYAQNALIEVLANEKNEPATSFSSMSTARALAKSAYHRAVHLSPPGMRVCGVAATCALVSNDPKKGDHRACVATHSTESVAEYFLKLEKGNRERWEEEILSSRLVLQAILDDCGTTYESESFANTNGSARALPISQQSTMSLVRHLLRSGDELIRPKVYEHGDCINDLERGGIKFAEWAGGNWSREATCSQIVFPGSFNPLHYGHRELLDVVKAMYPSEAAAFEISITNADKSQLNGEILRSRLRQFHDDDIVLFTRAPLFSQKADILPNSRFVVGVDTAARIITSKYYNGVAGMVSALVDIKSKGCSFLVGGRLQTLGQTEDGSTKKLFQTLRDLQIPEGLEALFKEISSDTFRADVSSTEIRKSMGNR